MRELIRRHDIVDFVDRYWRANGYGPTLREIASATGIPATSVVHHHMEVLRRAGVLTWTPRFARTTRLTDSARAELREAPATSV